MNIDRHGQSHGIGSDGEPGRTGPEEGIIFHLSFAIFHLIIYFTLKCPVQGASKQASHEHLKFYFQQMTK